MSSHVVFYSNVTHMTYDSRIHSGAGWSLAF